MFKHVLARIFGHGHGHGRPHCGIIAFAAASLLAPSAYACCGQQAAAVAVRAAPVCAQAVATCATAISMFYVPMTVAYRAIYVPAPVVTYVPAPRVVYQQAPAVARIEAPPPPQPDVQAPAAPRSVFQLPAESAMTQETTTTTTTTTTHAAVQQQAYAQQQGYVQQESVAFDQAAFVADQFSSLGVGPLVGVGAVPLKVGLFGRLRVDRNYSSALAAGVPFTGFIVPRGRRF
jgi:hypothetical protein